MNGYLCEIKLFNIKINLFFKSTFQISIVLASSKFQTKNWWHYPLKRSTPSSQKKKKKNIQRLLFFRFTPDASRNEEFAWKGNFYSVENVSMHTGYVCAYQWWAFIRCSQSSTMYRAARATKCTEAFFLWNFSFSFETAIKRSLCRLAENLEEIFLTKKNVATPFNRCCWFCWKLNKKVFNWNKRVFSFPSCCSFFLKIETAAAAAHNYKKLLRQ